MEATTTAATATHKMSTMDYVYKVSAGVSNAILVCLGIGLLLIAVTREFCSLDGIIPSRCDCASVIGTGIWSRDCHDAQQQHVSYV